MGHIKMNCNYICQLLQSFQLTNALFQFTNAQCDVTKISKFYEVYKFSKFMEFPIY